MKMEEVHNNKTIKGETRDEQSRLLTFKLW